jgi:hypothetical protein
LLKFVPVPIEDHEAILGKDFNANFAVEMSAYYAPFLKRKRDIQIAKETWEYAVADSIPGARWVGAGKNIVDVVTPTADIDVKGISVSTMGKTYTTEASFLQNHKKENDNFATLFKDSNFTALKKMFVDLWLDKVNGAKNLYLLAAVREKKKKTVYYCLLKIVDSGLTEQEFIDQMVLSGGRSVDVPMIAPEHGKTYIYISKRRLEIRLNCDGLKDYFVRSHEYK